MFLRTGNPTLTEDTFRGYVRVRGQAVMTLDGTVHKTGISLLILMLAAVVGWNRMLGPIVPVMWTGLAGGAILGLVTTFKRQWAPWRTPAYAAFEGLLLGSLSLLFNLRYPGIAANAMLLTVGVLVAMLLLYRVEAVRESENFQIGVVVATASIGLVYFVSIGLSFFGKSIPLIHQSGPLGILFSLVVVVIAALNLVLDFQFIERGVRDGAPKYMEWYGAFGLLVTLVWLYLEILRLLAKLQDRRR
jgi:uncharacterized YccA/Bax inhibitor family protein